MRSLLDHRLKRRLLPLLTALMMLVAACTGNGVEDTTTTAADGGETTTDGGETTTTAADDDGGDATEGGTLEVAILAEINGFDPMDFSAFNFPIIKNIYDSLIEYTPEGEAIPWLATDWEIAEGNTSVTVTLRDDVTFHSGAPLDSAAVARTLEKAADPELGRNLFATMAIVEDWETPDDQTVVLNFTRPVPTRAITDLLQFFSIIDPTGIDDVAETPAGSGPFMLESRRLGEEIRLVANPDYWAEGPFLDGINLRVFDDADAASAALENGEVDLVYNVSGREGVRLRDAGFNLIEGPGPLVQTLRTNPNNGPLQNQTFRQALTYLLNRPAILDVGFANLGVVTVLPWAPNSPAADPAFNETYAYNPERAQELLEESGLSEAEMEDMSILVNSGDAETVAISQLVQADLANVGIDIELDLLEGAEWTERLLGGDFDLVFAGIGNVQKFPSRLATNSIYRTESNPVIGDPMFPEYVEAIERVNTSLEEDELQAAYDNLNQVLMDLAFALPTNTWQFGLMIASPEIEGFTLDIDNMLVGRTLTKG